MWDDAPHAALGRVYLEAVGGDTPLDRAQRVQKLVKQNPDHAESHRIGADAALTARMWGEARKHLERLIELEQAADGVSADTCRRMARLEGGEHGAGSSGERQWLDMAAEARGGTDWVCETCGTLGAGGMEAAGWQLCCPRCDAIDSLVWRPAGGASRQSAAAWAGSSWSSCRRQKRRHPPCPRRRFPLSRRRGQAGGSDPPRQPRRTGAGRRQRCQAREAGAARRIG